MLSFIETAFRGIATTIFRHPLKAFVIVALFVGFAVSNLPNLESDGRIEAFMHEDDPALQAYYEMRQRFGQDNRIVATVSGPDIFDTEFLEVFRDFHQQIAREVPYIAHIFSPFNIPFIQHEDGGMYLEELVRNMLVRGQNPEYIRDRITNTPLYQNFVVSADGTHAAVIVEPYRYAPHESDCVHDARAGVRCEGHDHLAVEREFLGTPQYREMSDAIHAIAAEYQDDELFDIHIAGSPIVSTEIVNLMSQDMPRFTLLCVAVALVIVMAVFRSFVVFLASLAAFAMSIFSVLGLMAFFGYPITPPTQLLIPLILVVSLCSFIHFVAALLAAYTETGEKVSAIAEGLRKSHAPILFSALTTAAGLVAFTTSSLAPIATLGIFGSLGVVISFLMSLVTTMILFRVLPKKSLEQRMSTYPGLTRFMVRVAMISTARPRTVLGVTAAILVVSLFGIRQLDYSHNSLLWLPEDNQVRTSTLHIDSHMQGTVNLEVLLRPSGERDFRNEELMQVADRAAHIVHDEVDIPMGRHISLIDFVKELNQAINQGLAEEYRVPGQRNIWEQTLLLEGMGNDDVMRYASMSYDIARMTFLTPWLEATLYTDVIDTIQQRFESELDGMAEVQTTGLIALLAETSTAVLDSMTSSYALALVLITILMCVSLARIRLGLISMIPNLTPFLALLAIMGALAIPLDTFTVLIGALITGLIVDDTVHFFFRYRQYRDQHHDVDEAVRRTIQDIGLPIFTTSIVVMAGFAVFMVSQMNNVQQLGLLMMLGAFFALIADLVIAPALVSLADKLRGNSRKDQTRHAG